MVESAPHKRPGITAILTGGRVRFRLPSAEPVARGLLRYVETMAILSGVDLLESEVECRDQSRQIRRDGRSYNIQVYVEVCVDQTIPHRHDAYKRNQRKA